MAGIPGASFFTRFLGRTVSEAGGVSVGLAIAPAVRPLVQELSNLTWAETTALGIGRPLSVGTLASGAAEGHIDYDWAVKIAGQGGTDKTQFDRALAAAKAGPGLAEAYRMWRRGQIGEPGFRRAVKRLGLEEEWIDDLVALKQEILDPAQLAVMIQRTVIPNNGILPNQPSTAGSNVPPMPEVAINAVTEAAGSGIDKARLEAMARIIGLPASPDLAARMHFRKIITEGAFNQAILEGNTRGEWAPFLLDGFRQILTANQYAELELRGFLTPAQRRTNTAKHGMSDTDSDHLFDVLGRSVNVHQIVTGEARGGTYKPPPDTLAQQSAGIPPAFLASLQRGNLRPEYYDIAFHNRYTYPSFFAIRGLMQGGVLNEAEGKQILLEMGWKPDLAAKVAKFYAVATGATTAPPGPRTKAAQTSAITEIRSAYLRKQADATQAQGWLAQIGVEQTEIDGMLPIWDVMAQVPQRGLTAAQIKKAFMDEPLKYPLTWAVAELLNLGYDNDDAAAILEL
jgi:hypothetical protein